MFTLSWDRGDDGDEDLATPRVEHTSNGVPCARVPRLPLLTSSGPGTAVIDSWWKSHVAITKIVLRLLVLQDVAVEGPKDYGADLALVPRRPAGLTEDPQ